MLVIHRARLSPTGFVELSAVFGALAFAGSASAEPNAEVPTAERRLEEPADVCIARHRQAQVERSQGRLLAAHEQLRSCLLPECSPILREACASLLADVERETPSVVLAANSKSGDLLNVTVDDAGTRIAARLDGVPIRLDPGEHQLAFRAPGMVPLKKTVVLRAGDRDRRIAVQLEPIVPAGSADAAVPPTPNATANTPSHVLAYTLIGAGAALGVAAISVGVSAANDYGAAEDSCAPLCSKDRGDPIHTKALVADGLLVLSLGTISYGMFRLLTTDDSPRATSVSLGPGSISARGRF
jgi:hypothetical protein